MRAFQGTFAVDIWSIKCCVVDIWSIFVFFFWWSIFDKTPVAGLYQSWMAILLPSGPRLDFESREFMIESYVINTVLHTVRQMVNRFSR